MTDARQTTTEDTRPQSDGGVTRVTVTLRPADSARMDELASRTRLSKNDVIRKALATEAFVQRTLAENRKILVEDANGNIREVQFIT